MGNVLKKADMLGAKFEMNYGKSDRHKTCYGGILSIVAIICVLGAATTFIANLLNTAEVDVSTSQHFDDKYPRIKLLDAYIYPIIVLKSKHDGYIDKAKIKRYTTIYGVIKQTKVKDIKADSFEDGILEFFEFVPCSLSKLKAKETIYGGVENIKELGETFGLCPEVKNGKDYFVQGSISSPPDIDFTVYIYPCMEGKAEDCEELEVLQELTVTVILPEVSFNPKIYKEPVKILPTVDTEVSVHPSITLIAKYKLKTTQVYDDKDNWSIKEFGKEQLKATFYEIDTVKSSIKDRGMSIFCQPFNTSTIQEDSFSGGFYDEEGNWIEGGGYDEGDNWGTYEGDQFGGDTGGDTGGDFGGDEFGGDPGDEGEFRQVPESEDEVERKMAKIKKRSMKIIINQYVKGKKRWVPKSKSQKNRILPEGTKGDLGIDCSPLMIFQWNSGGRKTVIKRKYKKVLDTVGELGGLFEAMLSTAATCYIIYTCTRMDKYVQKKLTKGYDAKEAVKYSTLNPKLSEKDRLKKTQKALEELQTQRQDGLNMFKSLNHMSVIEKAVFKTYHKVLIPLALVNYNAKMIEKKEKGLLRSTEGAKGIDDDTHIDELGENENMSVDQALEEMRKDSPEDGFQNAIYLFLKENLPDSDTKFEEVGEDNQDDSNKIKIVDVEDGEFNENKPVIVDSEHLNLRSNQNKRLSNTSNSSKSGGLFSKKKVAPAPTPDSKKGR